MLAIPNTTTTALDTSPGAAVFPTANALTPYTGGYLFVANNAAQISVLRGPTSSQAAWSDYALVSPNVIPLSTDRYGRKTADLIYGIKAIDGTAGTPAQVFGALFQAGEAGFAPSAQFTGVISPGGGYSPGVSVINGITGRGTVGGIAQAGSGFTLTSIAAGQVRINFTTPFATPPIVVASPLGANTTLGSYNTYLNVGAPGGSGISTCTITAADAAGTPTDTTFYFIAIETQ